VKEFDSAQQVSITRGGTIQRFGAQLAACAIPCVILTGLLVMASPADARLYKWVDENGNVSYQDNPPPSAHQEATQVLNSHGVTVERIPGTEERRQQRAEQAKLAKIQQRDKALLDAYPTEEDLTRTRDKRLGLIDGIVTRMHDQLVILNTRLATIDSRREDRVERGVAPSQQLESDRVAVVRGINSTNALIRSKLNERRNMTRQFSADLNRYRELTTTANLQD